MFITREIKNKKFMYFLNNKQIFDQNTLERIRKLHIPPAWIDIKISISDTDYLQVTGNDNNKKHNRTQYIYHPLFVELSKIEKYDRLILFTKKLPLLIKYINKKLLGPINLNDKEYIIALIFRILDKTHSRIGNDCYAEENNTYGLTTLLKKHMTITGDKITFAFLGKKSVKQELVFTDQLTSNILKELRKIPGDRLFKTHDQVFIRSNDMNDYLKNIMGEDFTCKDFRTYSSNDLFLKILCSKELPVGITQTKRTINQCYDEVAEELGHTRAISRSSYVMPIISEHYMKDPVKFIKSKPTLDDIFNLL